MTCLYAALMMVPAQFYADSVLLCASLAALVLLRVMLTGSALHYCVRWRRSSTGDVHCNIGHPANHRDSKLFNVICGEALGKHIGVGETRTRGKQAWATLSHHSPSLTSANKLPIACGIYALSVISLFMMSTMKECTTCICPGDVVTR